ncbi:MAG: MTH938/NDUFAF3 family protein, partial [Pseudomonadota bacterium]|nr:MTH938/NDUFAF3 family protein [Pseudomonadota bacterium]
GFSFVFKARQLKHSKLCDGWRNAEDGRKDKQAGMSFDRNRLNEMIMKITNYSFGHIEVDGLGYSSDVIITPEGVQDGWWRKEGHNLAIEDLDTVIAAKPDTLIIGSGYYGRMRVPGVTRSFLTGRGIRVEVVQTSEAVEVFNKLQQKYARVVAALHLTC